jgi:mannose-6-phosphate isomerase-like protein (cupin superfamily)
MDRTPAPVSLVAARTLQPPEGSRAAEVFRGDHVWIRFAARPTSDPQVPHDRDEFYIVASGAARYRWDGGQTMIGPGDMMFAAAHTPHGYDQFSEDFSVWVVFYGPQKPAGTMTDDSSTLPVPADAPGAMHHANPLVTKSNSR